MLQDRHHAGLMLARRLTKYHDKDTVVIALPRGGVVVAYEVAKALEVPLDVLVVRKIGHPAYPQYAIGSVDKNGETFFTLTETQKIDPMVLVTSIETARKEAVRYAAKYQLKDPVQLSGKTVIIVDDGAATGLTLKLAITIVRKKHPKKIIVAVPVIPAVVAREIKPMISDLVTLEYPEPFLGSVSQYYKAFEQVDDKQVIQLLLQTI